MRDYNENCIQRLVQCLKQGSLIINAVYKHARLIKGWVYIFAEMKTLHRI